MARFPPGPRLPGPLNVLREGRDPIGHMVSLHRRYGDVFTVRFPGFGRIVFVADPALVKQLFTGDPRVLHAGAANATVLEPPLGPTSVLTLDEGEHMRQRKLLLPPFHGEAVRRYGEVIRDATERQMAAWASGEPFALRPHTEAITLEVILRAVFGVRDEARLTRARAIIGEFAHRSHPIVLFPFLRHNFGRRSPWARFQAAKRALDDWIYEEIAARREESGGEERDDVLSLLLSATHEDDRPMSDRELRDELVTVIGAGHETTATALAWAMERLVRNPRVMERLRESLEAGEQDYLDATIKETLRARPVISGIARKLTAPLEIGGYRLPTGTIVDVAISALHHREDLYPAPHEFRPERFLEEGAPDGYTWIPFGGGVRRCVGAAFAQYEMRVVLETILTGAELEAADPRPERLLPRNITLTPGRGTRVVLRRARPASRAPAPRRADAPVP